MVVAVGVGGQEEAPLEFGIFDLRFAICDFRAKRREGFFDN
jgi:hypothetical protein